MRKRLALSLLIAVAVPWMASQAFAQRGRGGGGRMGGGGGVPAWARPMAEPPGRHGRNVPAGDGGNFGGGGGGMLAADATVARCRDRPCRIVPRT